MNHAARKTGRKKRRLRRWFCAAGVWASVLALVLTLEALHAPASAAQAGIRLVYCGQERRVEGAGLTPRQLLAKLGLELTAEDEISPAADAVLPDGAAVTVVRRRKCREEYTQTLPAGTEYRPDDMLPWGVEAELTPGTAGEMRCVAEVEYVNGIEIAREVTARELLSPSQPRLVAVGVRQTEAPVAAGGCLWLLGGQLLTYTRQLTADATAFSSADPGCIPGAHRGTVVAAGSLIPAGTRVFIAAADGSFTYGIAQTVVGSMEGSRIDLYMDAQEAAQFGAKQCIVYFLG